MNSKRSTLRSSQLQESSSSKKQKMVSKPCTKEMSPQHDLVVIIKKLHMLSSNALGMLIRDAENGIMKWTETTETFEINVESLARNLLNHIMELLLSLKQDEQHFSYLLGGLRLLHTLFDISAHHLTLARVLVEDTNVRKETINSIFDMIIVLRQLGEKIDGSGQMGLLYSALLSSSLYLLKALISSDWGVVTPTLKAHSKVDEFAISAFTAVRVVVDFLQAKLPAQRIDSCTRSNVNEVYCLSHLCESSIQFLQSLCEQLLFRERLVQNKELCRGGAVLQLVLTTLKLSRCEDPYLTGVVYRLKSKVLAITLHLCEAKSASFLDMATGTGQGMKLVMPTVFEVLGVVKIMFFGDMKDNPRGILQVNAMKLLEIFSGYSRLRSFIVSNLTEVLIRLFSQPQSEFLSTWCSYDHELVEEDTVIDFDAMSAAGQVLGFISTLNIWQYSWNNFQDQVPYAYRRSSLLVKVLANLSCVIPHLCEEENALFINEFLECLQTANLPGGAAQRTANASRNLFSLLAHAETLTSALLHVEYVEALRWFVRKLEQLLEAQESDIHRVMEVHNNTQCPSPTPQSPSPNEDNNDLTGGVLTIYCPNPTRKTPTNVLKREVGQHVMLRDPEGEEIGTGDIHLVRGVWFGRNLEESRLCVVDVNNIKVPKKYPLPHPVNKMTTFHQTEHSLLKMRILWDSDQLFLIRN